MLRTIAAAAHSRFPNSLQLPASRDMASAVTLKVFRLATAAAILAIALLALGLDAPHIKGPWDVFILIDGGWRIVSGQVPNSDFHNPIGPLTYQLVAAGMLATGRAIGAIAFGNAVFMMAATVWIAAVAIARLQRAQAVALLIFMVSMAVAVRPLGYYSSVTSFAMLYNRLGWVLLMILSLQVFIPPARHDAMRASATEAISIGILLGLLFFCKVNFFIVGVAGLAVGSALRSDLRRTTHITILAFIAVCLFYRLAIGISVTDYVADIGMAAAAQSLSMRLKCLKEILAGSYYVWPVLGFAWYRMTLRPWRSGEIQTSDAVLATGVAATLVGMAVLVSVGNTGEGGELPLLAVAIAAYVELGRRLAARNGRMHDNRFAAAGVVLIALCCGPIAARDVKSMVEGRQASSVTDPRFASERLRDFVIPAYTSRRTAYWLASEVVPRINEGLGLLRQHSPPSQSVLTLALTDPFSFALGRKSATGTMLWWDLGLSHREGALPPAEKILGNSDVVMVPILDQSCRGVSIETAAELARAYGGYLSEHYVEAARGTSWILFQRRTRS